MGRFGSPESSRSKWRAGSGRTSRFAHEHRGHIKRGAVKLAIGTLAPSCHASVVSKDGGGVSRTVPGGPGRKCQPALTIQEMSSTAANARASECVMVRSDDLAPMTPHRRAAPP